MKYQKHLIECHCTLNLFKNKPKTIYHKIPVVSFFNEEGQIEEKYVICDNCGVVHRVFEIFQSEIKWGMEDIKSLVKSIEDIEQNLLFLGFDRLVTLLKKNNIHESDWEITEYCLENELNCNIVLQKNESDNNVVIKFLEINNGKFRIKKETFQRYF